MNGEELFAVWAPAQSPWSVWAKPVLFADMPESVVPQTPLDIPSPNPFLRAPDTAMVVDVPGAQSVLDGLALARLGYQPVPLYNSGVDTGMLVDMRAVANCLLFGAGALRQAGLPQQAPPVFLLNADRLENSAQARVPGRYDNRWCVVPQDMPSASFLAAAGIKRVVLVSEKVRDDLAHVLCRYQEAGLIVSRAEDIRATPMAITVSRPARYRSFLYRLAAYAGLRRNSAGGFGGVVPQPGSGGFG